MKKINFLIFIICTFTNCNGQQRAKDSAFNLRILLSDTAISEEKCLMIQKEINKLYFCVDSVNLNIYKYINHIEKYNHSNITKLNSHELSYCAGLRSILLSLVISSNFKQFKSEKSRFLAIIDSCNTYNTNLKGAYSVLLMNQSRVLSDIEKREILQLFYKNDNYFFVLDAIIQSSDISTKMDYYLFVLNLLTKNSNEVKLNSIRLLNDLKVDMNLLISDERLKNIEILQNMVKDNPQYSNNILLNRQLNELIKGIKEE